MRGRNGKERGRGGPEPQASLAGPLCIAGTQGGPISHASFESCAQVKHLRGCEKTEANPDTVLREFPVAGSFCGAAKWPSNWYPGTDFRPALDRWHASVWCASPLACLNLFTPLFWYASPLACRSLVCQSAGMPPFGVPVRWHASCFGLPVRWHASICSHPCCGVPTRWHAAVWCASPLACTTLVCQSAGMPLVSACQSAGVPRFVHILVLVCQTAGMPQFGVPVRWHPPVWCVRSPRSPKPASESRR